ncbi:MAG: trehalose operon repressor [Selenomonadaceae bacterium]|nr:trehalose operon repressor [Selenomonadaceae bacterium]
MRGVKFDTIFFELKQKIESGEFPFHSLFPSESVLTARYGCARNTVRRALAMLIDAGYIQAQQGKRVRVIYKPVEKKEFKMGGIESFKEAAERNHFVGTTRVVKLSEIVADEKIAELTDFEIGDELFEVHRVRCIDGKPLIFDINYFLKSVVKDLTEEIALKSIYEYLESQLGIVIVTSKRRMTTELATDLDKKYLELGEYNCLAVISGRVFDSDGVQFEYTQSRHRPDYFCFEDTATRKKSYMLR